VAKIGAKLLNKLKHQAKSSLKSQFRWPEEAEPVEISIYNSAILLTRSTELRAISLMKSVRYIIENNIPGDFIECGVAQGGSALIILSMLQELGVSDRHLYLYDLFGERPHYKGNDIEIDSKKSVADYYGEFDRGVKSVMKNWQFYSMNEVKKNLSKAEYPEHLIHFIKGDVLETIVTERHPAIALLRLDTDFYDSTTAELNRLYSSVSSGGVVIIDDYGHWQGAKNATDEFFQKQEFRPLLNIVDATARLVVKI
jgi:O-methyltransferase